MLTWVYNKFIQKYKNGLYKIASGCIAERLKLFLDKLIHKDHTGFIKGRFIGENIRLIYDIMHNAAY